MAGMAAQLGADVPFFLLEAPFALGKSRGDMCQPLAAPSVELAHVLVIPKARLSTKEVFSTAEFDLTAPKPSSTMVAHALRNGPDLSGLAKGMWNDLEPEAIRRCPVIHALHSGLRNAGCLGTLMSGSGPTVFGLCHDAAHATQVAHRMCANGSPEWQVRVVRTFNGSL